MAGKAGGMTALIERIRQASGAREVAAPFAAGIVAGAGIMTAHVPSVLEIVGPTAVLLTAGLGGAAAFGIVMQRMPGLSMSRAALIAATLGTAMTLLSTVTDDGMPGQQAETPNGEREERRTPIRFAPTIGALEPAATPVARG